MALGVIIIGSIVFQDSVESAFARSMPPALSLVAFAAFCPPFSGFSTLLYPLLLVALILSWLVYYIILYITYAIIGPDFSPSPEKGVTLVIVATITVAILHLMRVRLPILDVPGNLAQVLPCTFIFIPPVYYSSQEPQVKSQWHLIVLFYIPAIIGTLLSMFIIPHPAGQTVLKLLGKFLNTTAELQNSVTETLLLAEVDEKTGKIETTTAAAAAAAPLETTTLSPDALEAGKYMNNNGMHEGKYVGIAAELEPVVIPAQNLDIQAWQLAAGIDGLLMLSALEFDVYSRPHIFPKKEYIAVSTPVRTIEHLYITIAGFLQGGEAPMRAFPLLKVELEEVRAALQTSLLRLKEVIVDGYQYEKAVMESMPRVKTASRALETKLEEIAKAGDTGGTTIAGAAGHDDFIAARELCSMVIMAGKELQHAWEAVPALIAARQPEAVAVAESYFNANKSLYGDSEGNGGTIKVETSSGSSHMPSIAAAAMPAIPPSTSVPPSSSQAEFRTVIKLIPSCSSLRLKLYSASLRTGIHAWHLKMTLHMAVVFAVAATLCVIPAADDALGQHAYWIIINIFAVSESTTVSIVDSCWQRILGTAIGSVGVAALAGFGYLANGSNYTGHNTACRVTQVAFTGIWMGVFRLFQSKFSPRYYRFFFIITFLPPLIALLDSEGADVWPNIGWRLANTCIGIALHTLTAILIFPVTAEDLIREKTSDCLLHIAEMLDAFSVLPLSLASSSESPVLQSGSSLGTAAAADIPGSEQQGKIQGSIEKEEMAAVAATKVIISSGIQKASKSLMDVIKLRNTVDKEYFVSELWFKCFRRGSSSSSSQDKSSVDHQQQQLFGCFKSRAPMQVYHLDQLILHLKHNIVYSKIAFHLREWLRSQTVFPKRPEVAVAARSFREQAAECYKGLRLAILGLVTAKEALETVLNLRVMAEDIGKLCHSSGNFDPEETTIVHMILLTCRHIEFLFRVTERALITRDQPGVVNVTDQELQNTVTMLSLLNLQATALTVQAVATGEELAADGKIGAAAVARDGVNWLK